MRPHIPVLCHTLLTALTPRAGAVYVDGTFGAGGFTSALLASCECRVIAFDRDPSVAPHAQAVAAKYPTRFTFLNHRFSEMKARVNELGIKQVDAVVLDLGVSSMQIDKPSRGFSYRRSGPLDMRMTPDGPTAADAVNTQSADALQKLFSMYGEEKYSRRIAHAIVERREKEGPFTTTGQLADLVVATVPHAPRGKKILHPAARIFQALRILVNQELHEIESVLPQAMDLLAPGGHLAVISFHSLEDRLIKTFMRERAEKRGNSPPILTLPQRRAIIPSDEEVEANSRASSAKLRIAVKL